MKRLVVTVAEAVRVEMQVEVPVALVEFQAQVPAKGCLKGGKWGHRRPLAALAEREVLLMAALAVLGGSGGNAANGGNGGNAGTVEASISLTDGNEGFSGLRPTAEWVATAQAGRWWLHLTVALEEAVGVVMPLAEPAVKPVVAWAEKEALCQVAVAVLEAMEAEGGLD